MSRKLRWRWVVSAAPARWSCEKPRRSRHQRRPDPKVAVAPSIGVVIILGMPDPPFPAYSPRAGRRSIPCKVMAICYPSGRARPRRRGCHGALAVEVRARGLVVGPAGRERPPGGGVDGHPQLLGPEPPARDEEG